MKHELHYLGRLGEDQSPCLRVSNHGGAKEDQPERDKQAQTLSGFAPENHRAEHHEQHCYDQGKQE